MSVPGRPPGPPPTPVSPKSKYDNEAGDGRYSYKSFCNKNSTRF